MTGMSAAAMASTAGRMRRAALELDRRGAALGEEAAGVLDGAPGLGLVGEKRHVPDDQRAPGGARDGARVADIASIVAVSVFGSPYTAISSESPTSRTSTPAASRSAAVGAS